MREMIRRSKFKFMMLKPVKHHPKVLYRWFRLKWHQRVRAVETELGEKLDCC